MSGLAPDMMYMLYEFEKKRHDTEGHTYKNRLLTERLKKGDKYKMTFDDIVAFTSNLYKAGM